ncbi:MAG: hypothetical protein P8104_05625, partial [Gammaproteobacteria bacterium]
MSIGDILMDFKKIVSKMSMNSFASNKKIAVNETDNKSNEIANSRCRLPHICSKKSSLDKILNFIDIRSASEP